MINLLDETNEVLEDNGKTLKDVQYIGSHDVQITMEEFIRLANVEYDNGFGSPHVPTDLMLIGKDWWLERYEYDGSESWHYKFHPGNTIAPDVMKVSSLTDGIWDELSKFVEGVYEQD